MLIKAPKGSYLLTKKKDNFQTSNAQKRMHKNEVRGLQREIPVRYLAWARAKMISFIKLNTEPYLKLFEH